MNVRMHNIQDTETIIIMRDVKRNTKIGKHHANEIENNFNKRTPNMQPLDWGSIRMIFVTFDTFDMDNWIVATDPYRPCVEIQTHSTHNMLPFNVHFIYEIIIIIQNALFFCY